MGSPGRGRVLNRLEALFGAIILNDIAAVEALLATDDTLVTLGSKRDALDLTINHWILFLEHGVSPKLEDSGGKSVLDWAKSEWIHEILTKGAV